MRESLQQKNPKFLDSETVKFQWWEKVCKKNSKIPWFWNCKFPMMRENVPQKIQNSLKLINLFLDEKNVETKKIQNSLILNGKVPMMRESLQKKNPKFLNSIDNFLDERKLLWGKKSKIPLFWNNKFLIMGESLPKCLKSNW